MDLAIRKAKQVGIAWVNCTGEFAKESLLLRWSVLCVNDAYFTSCLGSCCYMSDVVVVLMPLTSPVQAQIIMGLLDGMPLEPQRRG